VRNLQERNAGLVADLRLKTAAVASLEKEVREREEEVAVSNRAMLRLESSVETQSHEISILEESKKKLYHDLLASQVCVFSTFGALSLTCG
jgi:hypothetical protein